MDFDQYAANYRELLDGSISASGESGEYFAAYKAKYIARRLGSGFRGRILDFGCGVGLVVSALSGLLAAAEIQGFDESKEALQRARQSIPRAQFTANLNELAPADVVILANVLHHVPTNKREMLLASIAARMRSGGVLFIFEHNPRNPLTLRAVSRCPFDADAVLLRPVEAMQVCKSAKLAIKRKDYIVFFPRMLSGFRPFEPYFQWLPLGAQYCVEAEKK